MTPQTDLPSLKLCLLTSSLFSVCQSASPNSGALQCLRSSLFFIVVLIFLDITFYLPPAHTHTDTHSPTACCLRLDPSQS